MSAPLGMWSPKPKAPRVFEDADMTRRERVVEIADYLARHLEALRPEEASAARVLRELVKNQRLG